MKYDLDHCPDRRATESEKWRRYPPDVLPLWVADMDFVCPEPVTRSIVDRARHGIFGYPQDPPELRELIVERMAELYQWAIQPEDIVFQPGVIRGFNRACHMFTGQGGEVFVQTPVYPPILFAPHNAGLVRRELVLVNDEKDGYVVDYDVFDKSINSNARLFILCNPHNPVGRVFRHEELSRMAELCLSRGLIICSDEIHCDLVYREHRHIPIATLDPSVAASTITLMAPSKTFNIAGLDCSFAIVQNTDLRKRFKGAHRGLISGINLFGWTAAVAAYREGREWLEQVLTYLHANRELLIRFVENELSPIKMSPLEGTYLAWLDCRGLNLQQSAYDFFLKQAKVALSDGAIFGKAGEGFVRINIGCPRSLLSEALERMKSAMSKI
jgi:cysteine-S-conjugate beta-lyase